MRLHAPRNSIAISHVATCYSDRCSMMTVLPSPSDSSMSTHNDEDITGIERGDTVRLVDLRDYPGLDGQTGRVVRFDQLTQRLDLARRQRQHGISPLQIRCKTRRN